MFNMGDMGTVINSTQNAAFTCTFHLNRFRENWDVVVTSEFHRV